MMETAIDEITNFMDARFVTAPEACWRIFQFKLHDKSHAVERLPVHLENGQQVLFGESNMEDIVRKKAKEITKLEAWLILNQQQFDEAKKRKFEQDNLEKVPTKTDPSCHVLWGYDADTEEFIWPCKHLRYVDMPSAYTWDSQQQAWKARAKGGFQMIGRMYQVSPKHPELYALRMLLLHLTGGDLMLKAAIGSKANIWES